MGNTFDAYLAGRIATEPTLVTTKDGRPWTKFRLAVDDRMRNANTGEWETAQTIFHDVVAFGRLAERTFGTLHVGDAVIGHGEFRFRSYEDAAGTSRTGASFVASRIGPDMLLADVTVARARERNSEPVRPDAERAADLPSSSAMLQSTAPDVGPRPSPPASWPATPEQALRHRHQSGAENPPLGGGVRESEAHRPAL